MFIDSEVEDYDQEPLTYQPRLDLSRFHRLLNLESDIPERDQPPHGPATLISKAQNSQYIPYNNLIMLKTAILLSVEVIFNICSVTASGDFTP